MISLRLQLVFTYNHFHGHWKHIGAAMPGHKNLGTMLLPSEGNAKVLRLSKEIVASNCHKKSWVRCIQCGNMPISCLWISRWFD